jgi:arabinan endo-1,5-alpha-L-arabinosidase
MLAGGGKMVISAENRRIGAGHFGRTIVTEGVEKMSLHWEADMDMSGRSTLAIRPIVWVDDWPVSGGPWKDGTYAIVSQRRGYALELAVDFVRLAGAMRGFSRGGGNDEPMVAVADQKLEDVIGDWPKGEIPARISDIMYRPHQKWIIEEVKDAPGYLGGLYCKIIIAGTNRALAATADRDVTTVPEFTGAPEQLWRIDMLTDGTYRIMPKAVPGTDEEYVLISTSDSTPSLGKFNFASDNCKWQLRQW